MASVLKVDTITGVATAGSIAITGEGNSTTTNLQQGLCKLWCNNEQNSTHDIADSFNISSISDGAVGNTGYSYTNNMNNTGHAPQSSGFDSSNYMAYALFNVATTGHTVAVNNQDLEGVYTTSHGDLA